jgi:hypothetical protein
MFHTNIIPGVVFQIAENFGERIQANSFLFASELNEANTFRLSDLRDKFLIAESQFQKIIFLVDEVETQDITTGRDSANSQMYRIHCLFADGKTQWITGKYYPKMFIVDAILPASSFLSANSLSEQESLSETAQSEEIPNSLMQQAQILAEQGKSQREIAAELSISVGTVNAYLKK